MNHLRHLLQLLVGISSAATAFAQSPVVLDHDFRHGDHGWLGFFADHPPDVETDWGFDSGLRPLPAELGVAGTGFLLAGNNHSDDLAMLMKRAVGPEEGLQPNQTYRVSFVIDFASNAPSGAFGVGGSPGDGVYLKAGAGTGEPAAVLEPAPDHHLRPTVNVGFQSVGGPAATVAGVIANGRDASLPATYVTLRREHAHSFPVRTDAVGRLWLLVMTDSAFEGPTALYYQRIQVVLTPVAAGAPTRLLNLSGRAAVGPGQGALVAGVVVEAPGARLLLRGIGPTLAEFGVGQPLANPVLRLQADDGTVLASNDDWGDAPDPAALAAAMTAAGAFPLPAGSADAALLIDVPAGRFTAVVEGAAGGAGIALAEIYEVPGADAPGGRLLNLSTRALLGRDAAGIVGGFVVQGPNPERFLLRAVGSRLADFGIVNPAFDPFIELFRGDELIAVNPRWQLVNDSTAVSAAGAAAGAFPLVSGSRDAAVVVTLDPGAYTINAVEGGPTGTEGVGLVEIYRLP